MSEGPECKLTVDYLNKSLKGRTILDWVFCRGRYTEDDPEGFYEFDTELPLLVKDIACKGKFIYFTLIDKNEEVYYIFHSLITGRWQKKYDKYCKWFLELDNGETIWFRDSRSFSTLIFTKDREILQDKISKLGPDILTREFNLPKFKKMAEKYPTRNITSFLMDQQIQSGCGNYIKAEALWYSRVSPKRKVGDLSERELELLYEGLRIISRVSYNRKGLSSKDYKGENGNAGYFSKELKIYEKKFATRTKTADGRITYWDPKRQV